MKKFALILVSVLIMTVFIAFNYLLWDKGKIEDINASNSASISALGREINKMTSDNRYLGLKVDELESGNKIHLDKISQLEQDKNNNKNLIEQKNEVINFLKQRTDLKQLEDNIKKWVDSINQGRYDVAYNLQVPDKGNQEAALNNFTNLYKSNVKAISIKSIKMATEGVPEDKKGDMIYRVSLEVKKPDSVSKSLFIEGNNERNFILAFDKEKNNWLISDIQVAQ